MHGFSAGSRAPSLPQSEGVLLFWCDGNSNMSVGVGVSSRSSLCVGQAVNSPEQTSRGPKSSAAALPQPSQDLQRISGSVFQSFEIITNNISPKMIEAKKISKYGGKQHYLYIYIVVFAFCFYIWFVYFSYFHQLLDYIQTILP